MALTGKLLEVWGTLCALYSGRLACAFWTSPPYHFFCRTRITEFFCLRRVTWVPIILNDLYPSLLPRRCRPIGISLVAWRKLRIATLAIIDFHIENFYFHKQQTWNHHSLWDISATIIKVAFTQLIRHSLSRCKYIDTQIFSAFAQKSTTFYTIISHLLRATLIINIDLFPNSDPFYQQTAQIWTVN